MIIKRSLKNHRRRPKQYTLAKAVNGELISGGRPVGSTGSADSQGSYLVVRASAGYLAIKTGSVQL